jgi:hypothetical protein
MRSLPLSYIRDIDPSLATRLEKTAGSAKTVTRAQAAPVLNTHEIQLFDSMINAGVPTKGDRLLHVWGANISAAAFGLFGVGSALLTGNPMDAVVGGACATALTLNGQRHLRLIGQRPEAFKDIYKSHAVAVRLRTYEDELDTMPVAEARTFFNFQLKRELVGQDEKFTKAADAMLERVQMKLFARSMEDVNAAIADLPEDEARAIKKRALEDELPHLTAGTFPQHVRDAIAQLA